MESQGTSPKHEAVRVEIRCQAIGEAIVIEAIVTESISKPFEIQVVLQVSQNLNTANIINTPCVLYIWYGTNEFRYFPGIIENVSFGDTTIPIIDSINNDIILTLRIIPTFARMKYSIKYRSFQDLSREDIIRQVFKEHNITNLHFNLQFSTPEKMMMCVQYGENDLHFASRLLEESGLFFITEYHDEGSTLHISDNSISAKKISTKLQVVKNYSEATYDPTIAFNIALVNSIGIEKINSYSYNERQARVVSGTALDRSDRSRIGVKEIFGPTFLDQATGNRISKMALERGNINTTQLTGNSLCPELSPGVAVEISGARTANHNGEFFLLLVTHRIKRSGPLTTWLYDNSFETIPISEPFRPKISHEKKRIYGCQTAIVTGPSGEETFCDENSSIQVKFFWDSRSQENEKSSCKVRVAQSWAGNKYGAAVIPRIGMEVIIGFINGDPDLPVVLGCLYNGVNKPPPNYSIEGNIATFYTHSLNGNGFNEVSFNDKGGAEEIFIHAQKDFNVVIEHSGQETLIEGSKNIFIKKGDYTIILDEGNHSCTLKDGNQSFTLQNGNLTFNVEGNVVFKAAKSVNFECGEDFCVTSSKNTIIKSSGKIDFSAKMDFSVKGQKTVMESITTSEFKGTKLQFNGTLSVEMKGMEIKAMANANLDLSSMAIAKVNSMGMLTVGGTGGLSLQGALIKLN
jgi:type VI secretion system secreted protein VgrG